MLSISGGLAHGLGNVGAGEPQISNEAPAIVGTAHGLPVTATATSAATVTHFVISLPPGVTAGTSVGVQLLAENAQNHLVTDFADTVDLSSSDTAATLPASVTFQNGRAQLQVTFATAGSQTLTATDEVDASLVASAATNVAAPDVATHYVLYMPLGAKADTPITVQIIAEDAGNYLMKGYSGTANITSSDAAATLPATVTFVNGHATFQVTLATAGLQSVTATDAAAASLTGTATTNVVSPAVATHFAIRLSAGATIGSSVNGEIVAEDAQNHEVSSYSGTAQLSSTDTGITLPASVTFDHGRATFQATFATAGQQTITASDSANSLTGSATTSVSIPYYSIQLPVGVTIGKSITVNLVARDAEGHLLSSYSGTANLTSTDSAATFPASITFANGRASTQVTFATAGQQTLTATDSVSSSPVGTATTNVAVAEVATHFAVTMTPGATVGAATTVRVVAEDAQNRVVSGYDGTATVTSSDPGATLPTSITFHNGQAQFFQVTFATAGSQTVTVSDNADSSIAGTASTNVAAAAVATHFVLYIPPGISLGEPTTVLIVAEDAQNHLVPNYSGTIDLSSSDAAAKLPATVTMQNGVAHVRITLNTLGAQTVTAVDSVNAAFTATGSTNVAQHNLFSGLLHRFR